MNPESANTRLEVHVLQRGRRVVEKFGDRNVQIIEANPERSDLMRQYGVLFPGDRRVKVSSGGLIYVSKYNDVNDQEIEMGEIVQDPTIKKVKRIWAEYQGTPHAIRGVRNIQGQFQPGGEEYANLRAVSFLIRNTMLRLRREGGVSSIREMETLSEEAAGLMLERGLETAIKPEKIQLKKRLERAFAPTDSAGRFNPSATRMQLAYALLDALPLFLFEDKVREKYGHIGEKLVRRDFMERMNLSLVRDLLTDLQGISLKSAEYSNRMNDLKEFAKIALSDDSVATLPYKTAALLGRLAICGPVSGEEINVLSQLGIEKEVAFSYIGGMPLEFEQHATRSDIMNRCSELLNKALALGSEQLEKGLGEY